MDKLTLVIGNKNYSSWSMRPWIVMKYFQIPFEEIFIPLRQPGSKEKILEHSPAGKVPVLKHQNLAIWETIAICEYLAEIFPAKNLWPKDQKARAVARAVVAEMHAGFMDLRKNCPMNVKASKPMKEFSPEVSRDIERITALWEDCRKRFGSRGDFLFGEFSIADGFYAPVVWRFNTYGAKLSGTAKKYFETMMSLPVMKEWKDLAVKEKYVIE